MQKIKSVTAVLLAVLLIAVFPIQAFAADAQLNATVAHTHKWYVDHYDYTYMQISDSQHYKMITPVKYCSVSGCSKVELGDSTTVTQSHSTGSYSYTGNNYHSGKYHYVRYEKNCSLCGYTEGYWDHYSCPGNGHCILPQSVFPVLTDK